MALSSEVKEKLNNYVNNVLKENIVIEVRKKPLYLSCFLIDESKSSDDIILLYKSEEQAVLGDETLGFIRDTSLNMSEVSDVGGNPLENTLNKSDVRLEDFTVNETINLSNKEPHYPISSSSALRILNYANINLNLNLPIWILHNSTDNQKSILLGASKFRNWYTRSWITLQGILDKQPTIDEMLAKHYSYSPVKNKVTAEVACKFCLSNLLLVPGSIYVHATWNKASFEIPTNGKSMSLELNVKVNDIKSNLYSLWQQLLLLQKCYNIVSEWKKSSHPLFHQHNNISLPTSTNIFNINRDEVSITERIIDVLMSPHHWSTDYRNTSSSFESISKDIKNGQTYGMDLTDRLWLLLSECSTYEELITNMTLVYQQVRKCPIQPFIKMQNKSKLAEMIRILTSDSSVNPQLMLEPLEVLTEIGLEKLKNDYIALFTQSNIVKEEMLNIPNIPSFTTMDSQTWLETVSTFLGWMTKIHTVAELVSIALPGVTNVSPSKETIIKRIFSYCLSPQESPVRSLQYLCENPDVKFITPINHISQVTRNMNYIKWIMKLTTSNDHLSVTNWFLHTAIDLLPKGVSLDFDVESMSVNNSLCDGSSDSKYSYVWLQKTSCSNALGKDEITIC